MQYFMLGMMLSIKLLLLVIGLSSGFWILTTAINLNKKWLSITGQVFAWLIIACTLFNCIIMDLSIFNILRNKDNLMMHNCPFHKEYQQGKAPSQDKSHCPMNTMNN